MPHNALRCQILISIHYGITDAFMPLINGTVNLLPHYKMQKKHAPRQNVFICFNQILIFRVLYNHFMELLVEL